MGKWSGKNYEVAVVAVVFKISFEFCRFVSFRRSSDVNWTTAAMTAVEAPK